MEQALKKVKLSSGFSPSEIGARIGLDKAQSETAARVLANEGVLVMGFDNDAHFSPHFRKSRAPIERKLDAKKKPRRHVAKA